ncbi:ATP-binding protein, partial [Streptomyces sp. LcepLS]|uniref:ATP-binding protein n=1 Tax=Streptomyces sp. LcepLS TaxID=1839764 RepID=UPI00351DD04D
MLGREQNQSLSPVFVGRDAESGVLAAAPGEVSTPAADGPRALVLVGEAGVGKTRLVEEFGREARRAGALVAVGGCVELGGATGCRSRPSPRPCAHCAHCAHC